mgnify:CR=1 FL=1
MVTPEEQALIADRMAEAGISNMGAYMQQRKQHTAFAVDGYAITASFADCKNAAALHHVKQILLSSFANNTAKNSSGDILAIPPEQRDNNGGGSPYVP